MADRLRWQLARASNLALSVVVDVSGNVYIAGSYSGPSTSVGGPALPSVTSGRRAYLASYTSTGSHRWSRAIGDVVQSESETDYGLELGPGSSLLMVGGYTGTSDFGGGPLPAAAAQDAFVARLDREGGTHLGSARAHTSERNDGGLDVAPVAGFAVVVGREGTLGEGGFVRFLPMP